MLIWIIFLFGVVRLEFGKKLIKKTQTKHKTKQKNTYDDARITFDRVKLENR